MCAANAKVYLIGAGPGAADLITLRAVRALAEADVVLVDDLVNRAVLAHCREGVKIIAVGKRAGCVSAPQDFIQRLMLRYARQGYTVARVKGGDPFVFGRGGEEIDYLGRRGIVCEVVSGISAGFAVPAAVGIPVTHRDFVHGVTFVTGHARSGAEPAWDALARSGTTLVIFMGLGRIEGIAKKLISHGLPADTPATVIEQGTLAAQRHVVAPLSAIAQVVRARELRAPALIVIGEVAAFARRETSEQTNAVTTAIA